MATPAPPPQTPLQTPQPSAPVQQPEAPTAVKKRKSSALAIIFWMLVFPPTAFVLMWRDERYHSWFGMLLIILSAGNLFAFIPMAYALYSGLTGSAAGSSQTPTGLVFVTAILAFAGIFAGLIYRAKIRAKGRLSVTDAVVLSALMIVQFLPTMLLMQLYVDRAMRSFQNMQQEMIF